MRELWSQTSYVDAARAVATIRLGLPFPSPVTAPLSRQMLASSGKKLKGRLVVLLVGYAALVHLGISDSRARGLAHAELEQARKLWARLGFTEAKAFALARRFVDNPKNWRAIDWVAGEIWYHVDEIEELVKKHARDIGHLVHVADHRRREVARSLEEAHELRRAKGLRW